MSTKQALATVASLISGMFMMAAVIAVIAVMSHPAQATDADTITQRLTSGDTAYENAYMDGAQDALQSPEDTLETLFTICGERGGVMAEDYSCIENPREYYSK